MALLFFLLVLLTFSFHILRSLDKGIILICIWSPFLDYVSANNLSVFTILIFACLFLLLTKRKNKKGKNKKFPFLIPLLVLAASYVISTVFAIDPQPKFLLRILAWIVMPYLLWNIFNQKPHLIYTFSKNSLYFLFPLTLYGVFEALNNQNPIIDYFNNIGILSILQDEDYTRFGIRRSQSFLIWCSVFGIVSGYYFILHIWIKNIVLRKNKLIRNILIMLLLISVFITGTRSVYIGVAVGMLSLLPLLGKNKELVISGITLIIVAVLFNINYFQQIYDSFADQDNTSGSSIEMRQEQLTASLLYAAKSPLVGNGVGYTGEITKEYSDLRGAESIIFSTLIDRGNLGVLSLIIFVGYILFYLISNKYNWLVLIPFGFILAKVISLIPGLYETYFFIFLIPLISAKDLKLI